MKFLRYKYIFFSSCVFFSDNEKAARIEARLKASHLDEDTKDELMFLGLMDCLHLKH